MTDDMVLGTQGPETQGRRRADVANARQDDHEYDEAAVYDARGPTDGDVQFHGSSHDDAELERAKIASEAR